MLFQKQYILAAQKKRSNKIAKSMTHSFCQNSGSAIDIFFFNFSISTNNGPDHLLSLLIKCNDKHYPKKLI